MITRTSQYSAVFPNLIINPQACIPVGCIPPALYHTGRGLCPRSLCPGGLCPGGVSVEGSLCPGGSLSGGSLSGRPTPTGDRRMPVKILPCPKLRLPAVTTIYALITYSFLKSQARQFSRKCIAPHRIQLHCSV